MLNGACTGPPVALVTGGAAGIGAAVCARLAAGGHRVAVVDRDAEAATRVAAECSGLAVACDVTSDTAMGAAVDEVETWGGRLDLVVLNAGSVGGQSGIDALDVAAYRRVMGVNVDHVVFGLNAALPALRRAGGGTVIATSSLAGLVGHAGRRDLHVVQARRRRLRPLRRGEPGGRADPRDGGLPRLHRHRTDRGRPRPVRRVPAARRVRRRRRRRRRWWRRASRGSAGSSSPVASRHRSGSAASRARPRPAPRRRCTARAERARLAGSRGTGRSTRCSRSPTSRARLYGGRDARARGGRGPELRRHPLHRRRVPGARAAAVHARPRGGGRDRRRPAGVRSRDDAARRLRGGGGAAHDLALARGDERGPGRRLLRGLPDRVVRAAPPHDAATRARRCSSWPPRAGWGRPRCSSVAPPARG